MTHIYQLLDKLGLHEDMATVAFLYTLPMFHKTIVDAALNVANAELREKAMNVCVYVRLERRLWGI